VYYSTNYEQMNTLPGFLTENCYQLDAIGRASYPTERPKGEGV
jgi:hypothetical protein